MQGSGGVLWPRLSCMTCCNVKALLEPCSSWLGDKPKWTSLEGIPTFNHYWCHVLNGSFCNRFENLSQKSKSWKSWRIFTSFFSLSIINSSSNVKSDPVGSWWLSPARCILLHQRLRIETCAVLQVAKEDKQYLGDAAKKCVCLICLTKIDRNFIWIFYPNIHNIYKCMICFLFKKNLSTFVLWRLLPNSWTGISTSSNRWKTFFANIFSWRVAPNWLDHHGCIHHHDLQNLKISWHQKTTLQIKESYHHYLQKRGGGMGGYKNGEWYFSESKTRVLRKQAKTTNVM